MLGFWRPRTPARPEVTVRPGLRAGEGGAGSPPSTGCGLLEAPEVSGFQVRYVRPRPTWGPKRCLRLPKRGDLGDPRARPQQQVLAAGRGDARRRARVLPVGGEGLAAPPPPPDFEGEGAAPWTWRAEPLAPGGARRDGGGRHLGAAAGSPPGADAGAAQDPDPDLRPPASRACTAAAAGKPPAAPPRGAVLGAPAGKGPRGRPG